MAKPTIQPIGDRDPSEIQIVRKGARRLSRFRGSGRGYPKTRGVLLTLSVGEALELVLLIRDQEPARFERAALRSHARYCREVKGVEPGEALAVLALLGMLEGKRGQPAARALAELVYRRGTEPASEALMRWAQ